MTGPRQRPQTIPSIDETGPMYAVTLAHTFDAAHRLPHLPGKCFNLHGHTWRVQITIAAHLLTTDATLVEFGAFKKLMRDWIDEHLDHAALLGHADPLVAALRDQGCRVYEFGNPYDSRPGLPWPTVEAVAATLAHHAADWLRQVPGPPGGAEIIRVDVAETPTNTATWMSHPGAAPAAWWPEGASS